MKTLLRLNADVIANVAIVVTCCVLSVAVVRHMASSPESSRSKITIFNQGEAAEHLPGINYTAATATVVLYVRSTCKYCTASMPFYRSLVERVGKTGNIQMAVATNEAIDVSKSYLSDHRLGINDVVRSGLQSFPTPSLVVIDHSGHIKRSWIGQQTEDGETEILTFIDALSPS